MLTNPLMLLALVFVVLPWVIEWLFRRRRRPIPFAAMRFVLDAEKQKKIRLQDLLLLYLRMFALFLLVLALVRPILRKNPLARDQGRAPEVLMIFDATYSNAQQVGADTAFSLARKMGSEVVAGLPAGTEVTVALLSDTVSVELEASDDLPSVREHIERLEVSNKAGHLARTLAWVEDYKSSKNIPACEVYLFSDMQESSWGKRPGGSRDVGAQLRQLCVNNQVFLADTGAGDVMNCYLTRFEPRESLLAVGVSSTFEVTVQATGVDPDNPETARLTFYVNGEKQGSQDFLITGEVHTATFQYSFLEGGVYLLKAVLEGDGQPLDNVRYYLATVPQSHQVLLVDERADDSLMEQNAGLLQLAIAPPQKPGFDRVSLFEAVVRPPEEFSQENLTDFKVVVLANLTEVPARMVSALELFVREGGVLLVFLGEAVSPYEYNRRLFKEGTGLLPSAIDEAGSPEGGGEELALRLNPGAEEAFAHFRGKNVLEGGSVLKYLPLDLPVDGGGPHILARFSDEGPALVEKTFEQGRTLMFTSTANLIWGSLPLSGDFPVLVQELLRYAIGNPDASVNLTVSGVFDQPVLMTSQHLTLKRPDGRKARLTPARRDEQALRHVTYTNTDRLGEYEVDTIPEVLAKRRFVVNLAPDEPELAHLEREEFARRFGEPEVRFLPPVAQMRRFIEELHATRELAGTILWLLFIVLAVEIYLAARFGMRRV